MQPRVQAVVSAVALRSGARPTVTGRPGKTTSTIVQKLQRESRVSLANMQDLAGVRVTADMDRDEQDTMVAAAAAAFPGDPRPPKVVDRRADPRSGYRAVHLVVCVDGANVEVQVRTYLQDLWANIFERLGDRLGRGIRYDAPPADLSDFDRRLLAFVSALAEAIDGQEAANLLRWSAAQRGASAAANLAEVLPQIEPEIPPEMADQFRWLQSQLPEMAAGPARALKQREELNAAAHEALRRVLRMLGDTDVPASPRIEP